MNSLDDRVSTSCRFLALAVGAFLLTSASKADTVTLTDNGSVAAVNLDGAAGGNPAGMYEWTVTGLPTGMENQLHQQWFWYSIDGQAAHPLDSISTAVYSQSAANQLSATYANGSISVTVMYTLTGGGIGQADIREGIKLQSLSGPLDFHFYQYSDFNLLNSAPGDSVYMNNSTVVQWKGDTQIQETIASPDASHFEANTTDDANNTLSKLNGATTPLLNDNGMIGPGDATWAYQWDFANLTDQVIQKDKLLDVTLVPEPSALALVSLGAAALVLRRRTKA
jgi:hypothetical protein